MPEKFGIKFLSAFEYTGPPGQALQSSHATFTLLESVEDWSACDLEVLGEFLSEKDLQLFREFFARGDKCAVARCDDGQLACICWIEETTKYCLARGCRGFVIHNCSTSPNHRGKGLYPQTLSYVCNYLQSQPNGTRVFIDCSAVNYASKRGIQKAGFTPIGTILKAFRRTWHWRNHFSTIIRERNAVSAR